MGGRRRRIDCEWDRTATAANDMDCLRTILSCAAEQGCAECCACSERALAAIQAMINRLGRPVAGAPA